MPLLWGFVPLGKWLESVGKHRKRRKKKAPPAANLTLYTMLSDGSLLSGRPFVRHFECGWALAALKA